MAHRKKRVPGPQRHAEGQHGEKTHRRFIEQLHEPITEREPEHHPTSAGRHRLGKDRQQHDEAEKASDKARAMREAPGQLDDNALSHARIPHEGDTR